MNHDRVMVIFIEFFVFIFVNSHFLSILAPDPYGLYGYGHDPYAHAPTFGHVPPMAHPREAAAAMSGDIQTQPAMLTLKQFLASQDDSISDSDAITKYNEYKLEFRRQQLNEFFVAHKDEEW